MQIFPFLKSFAIDLVKFRWRRDLILYQTEVAGYQSIPLIVLCVSSAALVTILESSFHMKLDRKSVV